MDKLVPNKYIILVGYIGVAVSVIFLIWYVVQGFKYYSQYFDFRLRYYPPKLRSAPEDILGLGFFFNWIPFCFVQAVSLSAVYFWTPISKKFIVAIILVFVLASILDLILYEILKGHVFAQ